MNWQGTIYKNKFLRDVIFLLTRSSIHTSKIKQPNSYKKRESQKLFIIPINNIKNVENA